MVYCSNSSGTLESSSRKTFCAPGSVTPGVSLISFPRVPSTQFQNCLPGVCMA